MGYSKAFWLKIGPIHFDPNKSTHWGLVSMGERLGVKFTPPASCSHVCCPVVQERKLAQRKKLQKHCMKARMNLVKPEDIPEQQKRYIMKK